MIGLLLVDNRWTGFDITKESQAALLTFATTAAIAIEKMDLLKGIEADRELIRAVFKASNELVAPRGPTQPAERDPRQVAHAIVTLAQRAAADAWQAACLPWLRERDVALISSDTSNDCHPAQYPGLGHNGGIHGVAMGAIGLWLLDNPTFEDLAVACAERNRWGFMAMIAPLKLEHGTGSPVNPLAVFQAQVAS